MNLPAVAYTKIRGTTYHFAITIGHWLQRLP